MSHSLIDKNKQKNDISHNINNIEDIINKIKILNANINKKEDDIKNIINEKDDIIQKINNRLLTQEKELTKNKNEIKNLNELIEKINKENKKKDKKLQKMNDKLLDQEKIINEYKNKINGLDKKIIEMKNNQNNYKTLNAQIPLGIEEQNNNIDRIFHERQNNINKNIKDMRRYNINMINNGNYNFDLMPKKTIIFRSEEGDTKLFNFNFGTTLNETFIAYIQRVNKPQKINDKDFSFLFNGIKLPFWDNTKIEKYFSDCINPTILVFENDKFEKK
jgi:hypothetical protein